MNRDMYYQNLNQGYSFPGMFVPPSGYNLNSEYQAYGPNIIPQNNVQNNMQNDYENRIGKLERQVKNLDTRLQKLENVNTTENDNFYML